MSDEQAESEEAVESAPRPFRWQLNAYMFLATVVCVMDTGAAYVGGRHPEAAGDLGQALRALGAGWRFAVPLLAILLTHEFGHYIAARYHGVDASLPFFLPVPRLTSFGTFGAVIAMRGRIKTRDALLDIGASGPLAGLVIALPVLAYGLATSPIEAIAAHGMQEGQSLLYVALKRVVLGPIPDGYDVTLNGTAFAGWTGLFITALNLLPVYQLDGGHVAYALFGPKQNRYSRAFHNALLGVFAANFVWLLAPSLPRPSWPDVSLAFENSVAWLFWFGLLHVLRRFSGANHPPTEPSELGRARKAVAVLSLVFFVLLFMPTPMRKY